MNKNVYVVADTIRDMVEADGSVEHFEEIALDAIYRCEAEMSADGTATFSHTSLSSVVRLGDDAANKPAIAHAAGEGLRALQGSAPKPRKRLEQKAAGVCGW